VPDRVRFDIGPRSLGAAGPMEVLHLLTEAVPE